MLTGARASHKLNLELKVPPHWQVVPLEQVLSGIAGGGTPSRSNPAYWKGSIPWLTVKDMKTRRPEDSIDHITEEAVRNSSTKVIPADTLIIAARVGLGKVVRTPFAAAINQDLKALFTKPEIDKDYLEYWFICIADYLQSIGSGTTVKGIRLEQLRSLPVPLAPLEEQKKIVAGIESQLAQLDEALISIKRAKLNLKRYRNSVLEAAIEGKLTEEWRTEYPEVEAASELMELIFAERGSKWKERKLDQVFPVPQKWSWVRLRDVFDVITDGDHQAPPKAKAGIPFLVIGDVSSGKMDFTGARFVTKLYYDSLPRRCKPRKGDLLYTVVGSYGIPVRVDSEVPFCVQRHIAILKPNGHLLGEYLYYALASPFAYEQSTKVATGTAQKTVSLTGLRNIRIPLPPYDEQCQIASELVNIFSPLEVLKKTIETVELRAGRYRRQILSKAFKVKIC